MANTTLIDLKRAGAVYQVRGILRCVDAGQISPAEEQAIRSLESSAIKVFNYRVGDFAIAALKVLIGEKQEQDSAAVDELTKHIKAIAATVFQN